MNTHPDADLAHRLIRHAAHKAPAALSERLEEEWLADLDSRHGAASRLHLALNCYWATAIITRDFRVPQLAASGAAGGSKPLLAALPSQLPLLSRRTVSFIVIAGLHGLLIYGFATGLAQHVVTTLPQLTFGEVLETARRPPEAPPKAQFTPSLIHPGAQIGPLDPRTLDLSAGEAGGSPHCRRSGHGLPTYR
jgi:hypothetical protein